jgi:hypothetical protein
VNEAPDAWILMLLDTDRAYLDYDCNYQSVMNGWQLEFGMHLKIYFKEI